MSVKCELCGKEVASTQALAGHKRFAHGPLDKTEPETIPSTTLQAKATQEPLAQQPKNGEALKKETGTPKVEPLTTEVPRKVETVPALQESEKEPTSEAEPPSAIPKVATITTVKSAGTFTYEITLPADAFTLFNLAKACGLELNTEKLFDEWVWDCIRQRFTKDYKKQLVLAPVEE